MSIARQNLNLYRSFFYGRNKFDATIFLIIFEDFSKIFEDFWMSKIFKNIQ